jgi:peroxiredoxin
MLKILLATLTMFSSLLSFSQEAKMETIYKDTTGRILTEAQLEEIVKKGNISMSKGELENGKRVIFIFSTPKEAIEKANRERDQLVAGFINRPLADFNLTDLQGNTYTKETLKGKVIVLNFWFIACQPCQKEMPQLNILVDEFKNKDVAFLAPALDEKDKLEEFLQKKTFSYNIIPAANAYTTQLKVASFPTHLIVDKTGVVRYAYMGYREDIEKTIAANIAILLN